MGNKQNRRQRQQTAETTERQTSDSPAPTGPVSAACSWIRFEIEEENGRQIRPVTLDIEVSDKSVMSGSVRPATPLRKDLAKKSLKCTVKEAGSDWECLEFMRLTSA